MRISAINATTAKVTFNTAIEDVDFTNFSINGLTVTDANLSEDRKSVEVKVNNNFTRNQEYTLSATEIKSVGGDEEQSFTETFEWSVDEGITVSLSETNLNLNDTASLNVTDEDGKDVTGAKVELTSSNTNIIEVEGTNPADAKVTAVAEGAAEVTTKVTLTDGTILRNTFTISVEEVPDSVENQGYTLVADVTATDGAVPKNTVEYEVITAKNSMYNDDGTLDVAMYDTVNSDPETAPISFENATVRSLDPVIATASINGKVLEVTANEGRTGTASFEVTFEDDSKRTFDVEVLEAQELTDVSVDATSVTLSDQTINDGEYEDGVNQKEITVEALDQYDLPSDFGTEGKVTVTTNTEGLEVGTLVDNAGILTFTALSDNELNDLENSTSATFVVRSSEGKIVDGKVDVKYFEKDTDETPTSTKTINVSVEDVDADSTPVGLDVVAASLIDANGDNLAPTVADDINFISTPVYVLDADGNRIDRLAAGEISASLPETESSDWIEVGTSTLQFISASDAITLMTSSSTINVEVEGTTAGDETITQALSIDYVNSANNPASASVKTSPVAVQLADDDAELTMEELIFGKVDHEQLVIDEDPATNIIIAVKNAARNAGYLYNQSLVSIANQDGEALPLGVDVYGYEEAADQTGNFFSTLDKFSADNFDVDFSIANWTHSDDVVAPTSLSDTIALEDGETATFTLVLNSVFVTGVDADDNNLLSEPVTVNVTVTK